ncbi:hypothetical protein EG68_02665 [Paragonimus skrjabini miyazakii]|uniref:Translation initiation factor eIF2B subunit gamma n=1 Tax=Paragonimus skrjabini miyazakii TaxID=59628 RepID=A0A8S9YZ81_9TREM|nr:hypothetical protein EG68_02665 [Paragonimus skrjabini miyazakii]
MQAVIFAHFDPSELNQLTVTKTCCRLPFGSSTILSNLFDLFLECDISDFVITHSKSAGALFEQYVSQLNKDRPHIHVTLAPVPSECSVAECLSRIRNLITLDYVFLTSSTTVLTDLDLRRLFLALIRSNASMVAVFSSLPTMESKFFKGLPRELILTTRCGTELLGYFAAADIKKNTTIPRALTQQGIGLLARNDLRDIGLYLLTRSTLEAVTRLREDVSHKKKTTGQFLDPALLKMTLNITDQTELLTKDNEGHSNEPNDLYINKKKLSGIYLYEHNDACISMKLSDPLTFVEATRLYLQKSSLANAEVTVKVEKKSGRTKDYSHILSNCVIDPTAVISGCLVCSGCTVAANTRVFNSVLLPGVNIKESCFIQGCALGEQVTVETQCQLKNCSVAACQRVPDGTNLESEQLGFTDPDLEVTQA